MRRGISPVIATVILIAITIAIALAVGAWVMGIWGGLGGGERLVVSYARLYDTGELELRVKNEGTAAAKIVRIEVVGVGHQMEDGNKICGQSATIDAGSSTTFKCNFGQPLTVGARYIVKIFTEAGSEYSLEKTVEKGA